MSTPLSFSRLQPTGLRRCGPPPRRRQESEVLQGFPGFDPSRVWIHMVVTDDSWSLAAPGGNDPISRRYQEARDAVRQISRLAVTAATRVAVVHFDNPADFTGPLPLHRKPQVRRVLQALSTPAGADGTSELLPALRVAGEIADSHPQALVTLTVLTDWLLADRDPSEVFERIRRFPGPVHAVAMNAVPPLDLAITDNVLVTRVGPDDPPGLLTAAIAHSLTTGRPGRRHATLHRTMPPPRRDASRP